MRKEDKPFTGTEVGTLIESFRYEMSLMAEKLDSVASDVTVLKTSVQVLEKDMQTVKDILRIETPRTQSRLNRLETKVFGHVYSS